MTEMLCCRLPGNQYVRYFRFLNATTSINVRSGSRRQKIWWIRHSESKNVIQLKLSRNEVQVAALLWSLASET